MIAEEDARLKAIEDARLAEEMERIKLQKEEEERAKDLEEIKRAEAALAAAEARKREQEVAVHAPQSHVNISSPVAVAKKISTEKKYGDRFVWFDAATGMFHWAKTATDTSSKGLDVKAFALRVDVNSLGESDPNFQIILNPEKDCPAFSKGLLGTVKASSIDIVIKGDNAQKTVDEFAFALRRCIQ